MKKSIKKIISLALVMTMLLSTMMVVSAEGTIAAENVSFEEELMPMAATACFSAIGYSGTVYKYVGFDPITIYKGSFHKYGNSNSNSSGFVSAVHQMNSIFSTLSGAEISAWIIVRSAVSVPTPSNLTDDFVNLILNSNGIYLDAYAIGVFIPKLRELYNAEQRALSYYNNF